MGKQRILVYLILVSLIVLAVTMTPSAVSKGNRLGKVNLVPLRRHGAALTCVVVQCDKSPAKVRSMVIDLFGNVGLFLPFGLLAGMALEQKKRAAWTRLLLVFVAGLLLSTFIETTQFWLPTRSADVDDVIFNSSGALLGAMLVPMTMWRRGRFGRV